MKSSRHNFKPFVAKTDRGQILNADVTSARSRRRRAATLARKAKEKTNDRPRE